ncbi:MAG: tetratricopeptide repeat protein, partial [Terriglobia bacterium]
KMGNYAGAAAYYRRVLEEASDQKDRAARVADVRIELAKDYFLLRRYEDSLHVLEPGLDASLHSSLPAEAALVAGMDNLELNRLPRALKYLQFAVALDPESGTARLALGDVYARSNRLAEAAREYREQLQRTPSVADGWYKLGVVYSDLSAKTVQDFTKHAPENPLVRQLMAERLLEKGDGAAALHVLLPALSANPHQPDLHADVGRALLELGHTRLAAEQFQVELAENPESPPALLGLAEADALEGNWQTAFTQFLHLIRFHPQTLGQEMELPPPQPLRDAWQQGYLKIPARWADAPPGKLWTNWLENSGTEARIAAPESGARCVSLPSRLAQT